MKHRITLVAAGIVASIVVPGAQERIVLPRGPAPDQTVNMRMTQDVTLTLEPAEVPSGNVPAAAVFATMTMVMKTNIAQTIKLGPLDDRRRFDGVVTIDDFTTAMTMNGAPMPMPDDMGLKSGQQITIHFDEDRKITDVTADQAGAAAAEMMKRMIEGVMRSMPSTSIAVGETVAVPMALPLPSLPTGPVGDLSGEATMTLKSIATDGTRRLATFDSTFSAKMASAPTASTGAMPVSFDMRFAGGGTMVFDVDRGVTRSVDQQGTIDGTMSAGAIMPSLKLRGTIKSSTTSTNQ